MNRAVQLETLVGEQLVLQSVQGFEALSSLFELHVVAVSPSNNLALKQLLGSDACLKIETRGSTRYLHAIVTQAQALGRQTSTEAYYGYELILRP